MNTKDFIRLGIPLGEAVVGRFSDGEISVEFRENVRGKDVYVIQPTSIVSLQFNKLVEIVAKHVQSK